MLIRELGLLFIQVYIGKAMGVSFVVAFFFFF